VVLEREGKAFTTEGTEKSARDTDRGATSSVGTQIDLRMLCDWLVVEAQNEACVTGMQEALGARSFR
jgi:hypothetical protein